MLVIACGIPFWYIFWAEYHKSIFVRAKYNAGERIWKTACFYGKVEAVEEKDSLRKQNHFLFLISFWKMWRCVLMMPSLLSKSIWLHWYKNLINPKKAKELEWVRNPFAFDVDTLSESYQTIFGFQEEFIDIQCDSLLRNAFKKENLVQFWTKIKNEKSIVGTPAVKALLPFFTTCLCECGFLCLHRWKQRRGTVLSLKTTWDWFWAKLFQILTKLWKRYKIRVHMD